MSLHCYGFVLTSFTLIITPYCVDTLSDSMQEIDDILRMCSTISPLKKEDPKHPQEILLIELKHWFFVGSRYNDMWDNETFEHLIIFQKQNLNKFKLMRYIATEKVKI